jgi:hypothetical protein
MLAQIKLEQVFRSRPEGQLGAIFSRYPQAEVFSLNIDEILTPSTKLPDSYQPVWLLIQVDSGFVLWRYDQEVKPAAYTEQLEGIAKDPYLTLLRLEFSESTGAGPGLWALASVNETKPPFDPGKPGGLPILAVLRNNKTRAYAIQAMRSPDDAGTDPCALCRQGCQDCTCLLYCNCGRFG